METKEIIKKLKEYQAICDKAIDESQKEKIDGAVNWADLKCNEVRYCLNMDGEECYEFVIDEADHYNPEFQEFIEIEILKAIPEKTYIRIITEW